ncbi:recombination protein NinB [Xanthobacter sp. V2C-8]|uniref:recombination protein NinB n=1 Tax=Xanthobacter albus TaxID=3119929 RepID=UPI003726764E
MSRAAIIIAHECDRQRVASWAAKAPWNTRVEFKAPKRTTPQNDRMWAMLTDVAMQVPYHDLKLTPDDWKLIFLDALKREVRMVPNLDGTGLVSLGRSSSDLSKSEMSDLIELIFAFGAKHDVQFQEPEDLRKRGEAA